MHKYTVTELSDFLQLSPGRYWIGDPCYVFGHASDEEWQQLCGELEVFDNNHPKEYKYVIKNGLSVEQAVVWNTAYGDGCYPLFEYGQKIGECGVDAGLLSVIPEGMMNTYTMLTEADYNLGVWIELKKYTTVKIKDHNLDLEKFQVITDGSDDNDDYEE